MPLRPKFQLNEIKLDVGRWKRQMKKVMEEEIKEAARDWIRNALSIIPVWSRASHETFRPLADAVGFTIPTGPLEARKDRSALGRSVSSGDLQVTDDTFHFVYETNLRYLAINEFRNVARNEGNVFAGLTEPTPYNFTVSGAEQFKARRPDLPNPLDFQKVRNL